MRGAALIVLAWNQWPLTRRCLDSLLASELDEADIIVVDNGSEDDTPQGLAAYAGRVRVVTLPENLGFVRGMNAGIAAARPDDDMVLLNNDLAFTQRDWLGRLRDAAYAAPENGVIGCRLRGPEADGRVYHVGGYIEADDLHGEQNESGHVEREVGQYPGTRRVQAIAFALAYLRRDCLARIGALDEAFHSYFEDTDYCLRATAAGIANVVAGAVTLEHAQHGSTMSDGGFRARLFAQSRATFAERWRAPLRARYRGDVTWHGVTRFPYAHAQAARLLVRRLDARGLRMSFDAASRELGDTQDRRLDLAARRTRPARADASVVCVADGRFDRGAGARHRVALAFADWERVPRTWARAANSLDRLLVPDGFQRAAFAASGVDIPIDVLPLGVDTDYCHADVSAPRNPRGDFVFLAVVDELERDAPDLLVETFRRTFAAGDPVELVVHLRPGRDTPAIRSALAPLLEPAPGGRVRVIDGWGLPWHERAQLLAAADAYVSARRGGGWDPMASEAIAGARVLVATDFGSQADLVRAHGLGVAVERLREDVRQPGLRWAEPDRDALAAQLERAVAQRYELLAAARIAANAFAAAHSIDTSADELAAVLGRGGTLAPPRTKPKPHRPADIAAPASGQIVVLGMHRSGTSSVAGLLARMGVWAGRDDELLIGADNPKGHYELARLHGACLRRLDAAGGDWKSLLHGAPASAVDAFRREVAALLEPLESRRPWLIKEPRLCLVAQELLPLLTRPVFVLVLRDPRAVAASLAARDGLGRAEAMALWERYTRSALAASRGWQRVLVHYEDVLADPARVAHELAVALRGFGIDGVREPAATDVAAWIDPALAHAIDPSAVIGDDDASALALWNALRERGLDADDAQLQTISADSASAPRRADGR